VTSQLRQTEVETAESPRMSSRFPGLVLKLVLVLATSIRAEALDALPQDVFIKTHEQSFSYENLYALKDGKLWVKPNPRSGVKGDWTLFEGKGVPFGAKAKSFGRGDKIVAFSTEALMVIAASDKGRVYIWQPTLFEPTVWQEKAGQPFAAELSLPPNRDWSFSMSVQVAPKKRRTPMHDIDAYYEDTAGNRIEFGFTATIYVLDPDGQRIRYWDTGLPPAFYKAFATPERGRLVAERLSTSGSTIFVIDKSGKMYTRMFDYEMNGACPGLRYTFENKKTSKGDEILPLFEAERVLPLVGWREQEPIPLQGQAEQTTNISIHLTGQGNAARELRVQGRNAQGEYGYWWRPIFEKEWRFQFTGEQYNPKLVIAPNRPHELGRKLDKTYAGKLTLAGVPDLAVELVDFYYFETPATLRVHSGDRTWDFTLHTFDAWGPTVQQKEHPTLVGSPLGEPKLLVATLEVPDALLQSDDPQTRALLDTYFRRFHHVHEAFSVSADDARVEIRTRLIQRKGTKFLDYSVQNPIEIAVTRQVPKEEMALYEEVNFTHLTESPDLIVADTEHLGSGDVARLDAAIARNQELLRQINRLHWKEKQEHLKDGAVAATASAVFIPVNAVSDLLNLPSRDPLAGGIALTGDQVLHQYAEMNLKRVISNQEDYQRAVGSLERRIRDYQGVRRKLK
jgi:hypothetical protein